MKTALFITLLALAGCTGSIDDTDPSSDSDGGNAFPDAAPVSNNEPPELAGITMLHNEVRAGVGVGPMTWDPALAAVAKAWAEQCVDNTSPTGLIDHNDGRSDNYPGYVGENIYGSSGTSTAAAAVGSWAAEVADYNYATNSCSGVCGHYTQIVWRTSVKLGCAVHNCPGLRFSSSLVCNYSPGGNSGGSPY